MAKKDIIKEEEKKEVKQEEVKGTLGKEEKKKKMIQICAIAVGLIVVFIIVLFLTKGVFGLSKEEKLEKSLTKMGEEFYTEFYYTEISKNKTSNEVSEFLSKFQDVGIKVNLDNLSRYNDNTNEDEIANFKNDDGTECNKTNTRAVIYPKSPYGKNDYTIKAELDCGFETNEK